MNISANQSRTSLDILPILYLFNIVSVIHALCFQVISIWKERCCVVNKRLLGIVSVSEQDPRRNNVLTTSNIISRNVEIRKFIPKSPEIFSTCAYETSFWLDSFYFYLYLYRECSK